MGGLVWLFASDNFALDTHVVSGGYSKEPYAHACKTARYLKESHARHSPLCFINSELD